MSVTYPDVTTSIAMPQDRTSRFREATDIPGWSESATNKSRVGSGSMSRASARRRCGVIAQVPAEHAPAAGVRATRAVEPAVDGAEVGGLSEPTTRPASSTLRQLAMSRRACGPRLYFYARSATQGLPQQRSELPSQRSSRAGRGLSDFTFVGLGVSSMHSPGIAKTSGPSAILGPVNRTKCPAASGR